MNTQDVLNECTIEGTIIKLPEIQLERKQYLEVKKALEGIGGKWKGGKVSGFVFSNDPSELLSKIKGGEKVNLKKDYQFFATPDALADLLVHYADIHDLEDGSILEPSAGQGAIIKAIQREYNVKVDCYELMPNNTTILKESGMDINFLGEDFMNHDVNKKYDVIIANPPFTKNQDIDHLKKMYDCLKDKGRVVCITSESWTFGQQKKQVAFREWLEEVNAEVINIDKGTFKESGTMVGGRIIIIDK